MNAPKKLHPTTMFNELSFLKLYSLLFQFLNLNFSIKLVIPSITIVKSNKKNFVYENSVIFRMEINLIGMLKLKYKNEKE